MSNWQPINDIASQVQSGQLQALDLVEQALKTISQKEDFKAIIAVTAERARKRAEEIDDKVKNSESVGQLAGVPFIAKDNFLVFGAETTAASNILKGFNAPYQSTAIEKLEAAGAICVAKANLDAFAHGSSTENSDFMTTKNPHDKTRVPGGSSGGSAAAVMLDMAPFALGTDTGGSIRLPASFCGAVGLKPTYGLVSRSGVVAMASSTDVIGPIAKTVDDAALVLDVMAGKDKLDSTTIERSEGSYCARNSVLKGAKIGVIKEYMDEGVDPAIKKQVQFAIQAAKQAGAIITEVSMPLLHYALACYYIICPAEVSSNLSRYDGQRFGLASSKATNQKQSFTVARSDGFGDEAKRRIMLGAYVLSSGYYDAYYKRAQAVRTKLIDEFNRVFKDHDFLIGPTTPKTAFKIGENTKDPLDMYLTDIMTVAVNLVGVPAISIPVGLSDGLPIGLQLIAPAKHDKQLLDLAKDFEGVV